MHKPLTKNRPKRWTLFPSRARYARVRRFSFFAFTSSPQPQNLLTFKTIRVKAMKLFPSPGEAKKRLLLHVYHIINQQIAEQGEGWTQKSKNCCVRVMRERVITHVSTRLRKEAFPLPLFCCFSKQRVSKNNSRCFLEKFPCFWRRTTSFKIRKFFFCKGLYFSNRFSTFAIERHTNLRSPFSCKASLPTPSLRSRHW